MRGGVLSPCACVPLPVFQVLWLKSTSLVNRIKRVFCKNTTQGPSEPKESGVYKLAISGIGELYHQNKSAEHGTKVKTATRPQDDFVSVEELVAVVGLILLY